MVNKLFCILLQIEHNILTTNY